MNFMKKHLNYVILAVSVLIIGLDQLFKYLAIQFLSPIETMPLIDGVLNLTYCENKGAAFGIFAGRTFLLVGVTGGVLLLLIVLLILNKFSSPVLMWAVGLIIGGGIGNLIDRIFRTFVVDYIHVKFVKFAIFNFADCCVVVGTILFIFYFLFLEGKRIKKHDQTQEIDTSKQKEA